MNFNNEENKSIKALFLKSLKDKELELEAIIGKYVSYEEFINVLKRFKNKDRFSNFTNNNLLVISFSNDKEIKSFTKGVSRIIINGNSLMNNYYRTNKISHIQDKIMFQKKEFVNYETDRFENKNYDLRINLKKEIDLDSSMVSIQKLIENYSKIPKYFRRKTTFSFYDKENDFRIDLSVISRNKNNEYVKTIQEANILNNSKVSYEIEVEYIGNKKEYDAKLSEEEINQLQTKFIEIINIIIQAKQQSFFILGKNDKDKIENEFNLLTKHNSYLPNIVDLENKNIIDIPNLKSSDYPPNIRLDYCVTEKTDGIRQLLFINNQGKCYFKNRNDNIKYTGTVIKEYSNSIFDGELINKNIEGNTIMHYYIFDCYIIKNKNITKKPFGLKNNKEGRYYHFIQFEKYCNSTKNIIHEKVTKDSYSLRVFKKNYLYGGMSDKITKSTSVKIFDSAEKILNKINVKYGGFLEDSHLFSYATDGLIFQPVNLGVNQEMFKNFTGKIGGTWNSCFRWKPPLDLTIDFMIKFNKENNENQERIINGNKYIAGTLFIKLWKNKIHNDMMAYKLINDGLDFNSFLEDHTFSPLYPYNGKFNSLLKKLYDNTSQIYLPIDKNGKVKTEINQIINDGDTIECYYNKEKKEELRWIPKRIRPNKIPNAYLTAISTWKLINNPITSKMIVNKEDIINKELYYNNQSSEESEGLRKFNNFVKLHIIETACSNIKGKIKVLDLCCGRMGDFMKYANNKVKELVGIDITPDNIFNKEQGAVVRLLGFKKKSYEYKELVDNTTILLGDCTKNISSGLATEDALNRFYIDILYGRIKPSNGKLVKMFNSGTDGFNLIVCNLAIHYMFNTQDTLDTFFTNINENLNKNGFFIGCCLDGKEVVKVLDSNSKIEGFQISSGKFEKKKTTKKNSEGKSTKNKLIWSIENTENINLLEDSKVGQKIDAYMDTFFEPFSENLVDFDFLVNEFKRYDIKLIDSKLFIDEQNNLFNKFKTKNKDLYDKINKHSDIKQWIKFHRWFIFQKMK